MHDHLDLSVYMIMSFDFPFVTLLVPLFIHDHLVLIENCGNRLKDCHTKRRFIHDHLVLIENCGNRLKDCYTKQCLYMIIWF